MSNHLRQLLEGPGWDHPGISFSVKWERLWSVEVGDGQSQSWFWPPSSLMEVTTQDSPCWDLLSPYFRQNWEAHRSNSKVLVLTKRAGQEGKDRKSQHQWHATRTVTVHHSTKAFLNEAKTDKGC